MAHSAMSTTLANACLSNEVALYTWIQLHTADPGSAGTSNIATNTTRKQVTWGTPSGGAMANTDSPSWADVPASEDYDHWTAWSAASGGTFGFYGRLTATPVVLGDTFLIAVGDLDVSLTVA